MMDLHHLPNARENEAVELFLRRHWMAVASIFGAVGILLIIPLGVTVVFHDRILALINEPVFAPLFIMAVSAYVMAIWLFAFLEFMDYYLDVWIVTNERIINIEQKGLFDRTASELHLISIQDVTSDIDGILHTFLDYGDVHIQTAGETSRFHFKNVAQPDTVKENILRLVEKDKQRHGYPAHSVAPALPRQPNETAEE